MKNEVRSIEEICEKEDFHITLLGNNYCMIKPSEKIECKFRGSDKDHNGLYVCLNLKYYEGKFYKE